MPVYSRRKRTIIKAKKNKTNKSRYNKGMRGGYELIEVQSEYDDKKEEEEEQRQREMQAIKIQREAQQALQAQQKIEDAEKARIAKEEEIRNRPDTLFKGTVIGNSVADNFMTNVGKKIDNTRNSIIQSFQNKQPINQQNVNATEEEEKQKCRVLLGITEGGRRAKNYKKKRTSKKK